MNTLNELYEFRRTKRVGDAKGLHSGWRECLANDGRELSAQNLDRPHHFWMRQRRNSHLKREARDTAERFVHVEHFFGDRFCIADEESAGWPARGVELRARRARPAAFFADLGERVCVTGIEIIGGLLGRVGKKSDRVQPNDKFLRRVSGACSSFAIEIDQRAEAMRLAADDRDHERQAEQSRAYERFRRATDADPDRQRILQRARIDSLAGQRGAMLARPSYMRVFADFQQQLELFLEKGIIVFELQAEERVRLDERTTAGDDFGAPVGDEI